MNAIKTNALNAVFVLAVAALSYLITDGVVGTSDGVDSIQEPPFDLDAVGSRAWLRAGPPPSTQPYDGIGGPTLVVTHMASGGGLHSILHEAVIWSDEGGGGVDLCGKTRIVLDNFRVFYPTGGASPTDSNVTYSSNTYEQPTSNLPGSDECGLRAAPGRMWHWIVCIEFDDSLDDPRPTPNGTVFDDWDRCIEGSTTASAPSSPVDHLLPHG